MFTRLGRDEDPSFTVRTMIISAFWPGATVEETLEQVTERLERTLQESHNFGQIRSYTTAGQTTIFVDLDETTPLEDVIKSSKDNTAFNLVVALNYGARQEIVAAARSLAADVASGKLQADAVDWAAVEARLQTAGLPDPDLIIRTSGEFRLSNFLLLQSAYAEIVFASVFWPDFDKAQLQLALAEYAKRERRFGMTGAQVQPPSQA